MIGYGTKYRFEFDGTCNPFPNTYGLQTVHCKVLILKKGYGGGITDIPYGQATPVEIDYPTTDDDIFYPIRGSVLSFKVLGGAINMDSIISEDEKEYALEYYRDGSLFWSGFVSPELCEEDIFLKYPAIEFKTIDALGGLNAITFTDSDGLKTTGKKSIKDIIFAVFNGIGFNYEFNILAKIWEVTMNKSINSLMQAYVYINAYRSGQGSTYQTLDILKSIAYLFNAIIYQDGGRWWFVKIKDLVFGETLSDTFSSSGVHTGNYAIPSLVHGNDFLIVAEPKRKIRRFYKEASIDYKFFNSYQNLDNNFSIFTNDSVKIYNVDIIYGDTGNVINGVPIMESYKFTTARAGTNNPNFEFYVKTNSPQIYSYFDSRINDYGMVITATTNPEATSRYLQYNASTIKVGESFGISISSITRNPLVVIYVNGHYYDSGNDTWSTTLVFNGGYPSNNFSVENVECPYDGDLIIRLYAQSGYVAAGDGTEISAAFLTCYHGFYVTKSQALNKDELTTVTNTKNTSIIPDLLTVYNGDITYTSSSSGSQTISDYSNIMLSDGYRTTEWVERNEDFSYKLVEQSARNILNQYSDYRNIFTGTVIGKGLRFGAIYEFPVQGALANKKFFPLSMKLNERDCSAEVIFMELSPNEIDGVVNHTIFDNNNVIVYQELVSSKKKIVMG